MRDCGDEAPCLKIKFEVRNITLMYFYVKNKIIVFIRYAACKTQCEMKREKEMKVVRLLIYDLCYLIVHIRVNKCLEI